MAVKDDAFFCFVKDCSTRMFFANTKLWWLAIPLDIIWWSFCGLLWVVFGLYLCSVYIVLTKFNQRMSKKKK